MSNPYDSAASRALSDNATVLVRWNRGQWITAMCCILATSVLSILALVLIMQALRLGAEATNLPARFQASSALTARSSWVGGIAAVIGAGLSATSLMLVSRNKLAAPIALLVLTMIGIGAISVMFKPA